LLRTGVQRCESLAMNLKSLRAQDPVLQDPIVGHAGHDFAFVLDLQLVEQFVQLRLVGRKSSSAPTAMRIRVGPRNLSAISRAQR
jgi:hypothetical protein